MHISHEAHILSGLNTLQQQFKDIFSHCRRTQSLTVLFARLPLPTHKSRLVSMAGAFRYVSEHAENRTEHLVAYWALVCPSKILANPSNVGGIYLQWGSTPEEGCPLHAKAPILTVMLLFTVRQWHSKTCQHPATSACLYEMDHF